MQKSNEHYFDTSLCLYVISGGKSFRTCFCSRKSVLLDFFRNILGFLVKTLWGFLAHESSVLVGEVFNLRSSFQEVTALSKYSTFYKMACKSQQIDEEIGKMEKNGL